MKISLKTVLVGAVLALAMGSTTHASVLDVVRDKEGTPVLAQSGDCLRTNWDSDSEACHKKADVQPTIKISTDRAAVYFAFGSSKLTAQSKKVLDEVATKIQANPTVTAVRVAGYADRIGSAAANEKLSKRRADMVRKYLASKGVVNTQIVEIRWFGDSAPATDCKKVSKKKLIKCLQPDRRVEIEYDSVVVEKVQ
ncbi:MAG: OmpA family protein [Alphaproteobacteria bacterium]|jgi:outer membrane protein OmpA-like peptidoglycan-associated protein|nr:OmpA family protein [Alphaproteobacteria bacterium]